MPSPDDANYLRALVENRFPTALTTNSASEMRELVTMAAALLGRLANEDQARQNEKQNRRSNLMTGANIVLTCLAICAAVYGDRIAQRALSQPSPVCTDAHAGPDQAPRPALSN
jgi:hypothetical protein